MGLFEHWPYVNFHDMNLDWIIKKIKNVETAEANSQASAEASAESAAASQLSADAALASQEAAHQSELNAAQSEENAADAEASAKNYADHIADPVSGLVTDWLENNITPTTPAIDASLTVSGAAADAKATGDAIKKLADATAVHIENVTDIFNDYEPGYNLINPSGSIIEYTSGSSWKVSTLIDVSDYNHLFITASSGYGNLLYAFYDSSETFISGLSSPQDSTLSIDNSDIERPGTAKYIRVATRSYGVYPVHVNVKDIILYNSALYKWSSKKWVVIGDSLTENNSATDIHYFDYISEETGITVENYGRGGTGYANPNTSQGYDNFAGRMASVPTDADVYTIFGSFNDYAYSLSNDIPIGNPDDSGTSTLCGYFNAAFDALFTRVPLANLGVVAPCPWVSVNPVTGTASKQFGEDYVNALKECCERRSIPFLDLYHSSGMRPWDPQFEALAYTKDPLHGVHPDETGHAILSPKFKEFLNSLL